MTRVDISQLLVDWPYEPGRLQARRIHSTDGVARVQLRLNLGIVQMFPRGRPDGVRPHDRASFLQVCAERLGRQARSTEGVGGFSLGRDDCIELREEFAQFYQRCVALMVLEDHLSVIGDARHNLRIITFCRRFAGEEEDGRSLLRFWPHAAMTLARAQALHAVAQDDPPAALAALERGIRMVHRAYLECGRRHAEPRSPELRLLRSMRQRLLEKAAAEAQAGEDDRAPHRLQRQLDTALRQEKYELAIALRDQLQALKRDAMSEL